MIKKYALKFFARFFVSLGVFTFVVVALLVFVAVRNHHTVPNLPEKMVLTLSLRDGVAEQTGPKNMLAAFNQETPALNLSQITQSIYAAANDTRVKGLVVVLEPSQIGLAQVQELRAAVKQFKQAKKFAIIYAQNLSGAPSMANYWLATIFDQIWLAPLDELPITGFGMAVPFGKNLLDKLGIKAQLLYHGTYKGAHETYTRSNISPAQNEELVRLLGEFNDQFVADVAVSRHVNATKLIALMRQAPLPVEQAVTSGLADTVAYPDEFEVYMDKLTHGVAPIDLETYAANLAYQNSNDKAANIAVIYADGAITDAPPAAGMAGSGVVSARLVAGALAQAAANKHIKAIILRIDSPGGSPQASETIHRAIILAKKRKPVVVSMGNMAASGGYWIAAPASAIVAQPASITGSIGVFGGKVSLQGLWQKLGVNWASISAPVGDNSLFSPHQDYSPQARVKVQASLDRVYEAFVARVAKGRKLDLKTVDALAEGRVWTGAHAQKLGLVDALGGMDKALMVAKKLAKVAPQKPIKLVTLPEAPSAFEQFQQLLQQGLGGGLQGLPDLLSFLWQPGATLRPILAVY